MREIMINGIKVKVSETVAAMYETATTPSVPTTPATTTATTPSVPVATPATTTATTDPQYDYDIDDTIGWIGSLFESGYVDSQARLYKKEVKRSRKDALRLSRIEYKRDIEEAKYNRKLRDVSIKSSANEMLSEIKMGQKLAKRGLTGPGRYF